MATVDICQHCPQHCISQHERSAGLLLFHGVKLVTVIRLDNAILAKHGFTSGLSLGNLDIDSSEAKELMDDLTFGQKCLLRGLTKLCCPQPADDGGSTSACKRKRVNYDEVSEMVQHIGAKGKDISIKAKMGDLFHFNAGCLTSRPSSSRNADAEETGNRSDVFRPIPQNPSFRSKKNLEWANILLNVK